jgi:hypothetical protein
MLLQLENTGKDDINKLLAFARQNNLRLSLLDEEGEDNLFLPGKPLTPEQLNQLIENSRKSGIISRENAHQQIRNNYNAG